MLPMNLLSEGESAEILKMNLNDHLRMSGIPKQEKFYRLEELGIRTGKFIRMLNSSNENTVLIMIDNSRLAISRKIAMKIFVRKI